jgi:predicted ATPase
VTDVPNLLRGIRLLRDRVPSFDAFPFSIPAVRDLEHLAFRAPVAFLVGENGSGKSTVLEAVATAWGLNPEGGSRNFRFATHAQDSALANCLRLERSARRARDGFFFRAESYFNLATEIEALDRDPSFSPPIIDSYGGRSLHEQSHGESFFATFLERFRGDGFYVLDEPEAALSPMRQLAFLARLHDLVRAGSQFLIATHSPILMAYPNAAVFLMGDGPPRQVDYRDTEHFTVTRNFLLRPEKMLATLLGDPES